MDTCTNNQPELETTAPTSSEERFESGFTLSNKAYKILSFVPTIAFAVFAILMLAFLALLPVARVDAFGLSENYGNVLNGTRFNEIPGLNTLSLVLIVFAIVATFYAVLLIPSRFTSLKYRGLFGKPLYKLLESITAVFVLGYLVFSIAIMVMIGNADEGLGIIKVSLYPVLTAVLSVLCLAAIVIASVLCKIHEKVNPEILNAWKEERQKAKAQAKSSTAKKTAGKAGQKFTKRLIVPAVIVAAVWGISNLGINGITQRFESRDFNPNSLKEILVKDAGNFSLTKYSIEVAVGESYVPQGAPTDNLNATYYTENFMNLLSKAELNQKYALLAIEQGDSRISGLLKQAKNIETEMETLAYGKAAITYTNTGYLKDVVYNNVVIEGFSSIAKKLDSVQVFNIAEEYTDQTNTTRKISKVAYLATYIDGSFIYGTCENVVVVLADGTTATTYEGSCVGKTITWQDSFGSYEVVAPANSN